MAREIRILHTADTHLGYRQYHSEARRNDFFAAFELVVNDAVEMQVDAVVHAGDLFDSRNPTLEDLLETINLLSRLKAANIPFLGIVGNHESKQNTQWLDLFEEMRLAARLGKKPLMIGNAAIYGIDSVPKSKIPIFDYSGFEAPDSHAVSSSSTDSTSSTPPTSSTPSTSSNLSSPSPSSTFSISSSPAEKRWKLLVMHQIMSPFPYAEWDCDEVLENLPFKVDAILLGDYHEHSIIKNKTGETWITYPGSTERNSLSEKEARSYNIITLSEKGLEISKRTIPTRRFLPIRVELKGEDKPYEQIFSKVNEYPEEICESVVFLEIFGDSGAVLSQSELEEYLLNKGALVPKVIDRRAKESFPEEVLKVNFSDPDHAVASEIRKMSLNDGGLIIDEIVRSPDISRSRVDEETESRLSKLVEAKTTDFRNPDFRIEIPASSASSDNSAYTASIASSATTTGFLEFEEIKTDAVEENEFAGKKRQAGAITGKLEITELSGVLRTSDQVNDTEKKDTKKSTEVSKSTKASKSTETSESIETSKSIEISAMSQDRSELALSSSSEESSNSEFLKMSDSRSIELSSKPIVPLESNILQGTSENPEKTQEIETEFRKDKGNEPEVKPEGQAERKSETKSKGRTEKKPEIKSESKTERKLENRSESNPEIEPESNPEIEPESNPESELESNPENEPEKKSKKLSESRVKGKPEKEKTDKAEKLPEEEPSRATELNEKTGKTGSKKGRRKAAVPRQYNLGDYL
jgi:DNA repair protein SbcD/Mre11